MLYQCINHCLCRQMALAAVAAADEGEVAARSAVQVWSPDPTAHH